jgi:hypothetical protein
MIVTFGRDIRSAEGITTSGTNTAEWWMSKRLLDATAAVGEAGRPAEARDQYATLLPVEGRVLDREHPDVLIRLSSL